MNWHGDTVKRGRLLAFEGLDGCGKTTQLALLAADLESSGIDVVRTREYTDGPAGRRIRKMALSGELVAAEEELAWFLEDRRQHVDEVIAPALDAGRWVLTDRYTLSSVAYQGARGLDPQQILRASESDFPLPDLVLLFEIELRVGLERIGSRGAEDQVAFERRERLELVAEIFASLDRPYIERIDARGEPETVHSRVRAAVSRRLELAALV